ncbi:hypothetical protein BJV78DRAFT_1160990 [Lactifluus subvellereus]|nr:hypothetical protein BJV78DRAFT_1160990 [Lactifluus subvellereus]
MSHFLALLQRPPHRFSLYPQMKLRWNPSNEKDQRTEIPDVGIGHFTPRGVLPFFKLRCGIEAKRAIDAMLGLPPPQSLKGDRAVVYAFHTLSFQALNQAKAAYKNNYPIFEDGIQWILMVGPYWLPKKFGPFSQAQLTVRGPLKRNDSGDFEESDKLTRAVDGLPPALEELYLLGTSESNGRLEEIIASTDVLAQPLIENLRSTRY